jgi:hypothetical protein
VRSVPGCRSARLLTCESAPLLTCEHAVRPSVTASASAYLSRIRVEPGKLIYPIIVRADSSLQDDTGDHARRMWYRQLYHHPEASACMVLIRRERVVARLQGT